MRKVECNRNLVLQGLFANMLNKESQLNLHTEWWEGVVRFVAKEKSKILSRNRLRVS